MIDLDSKPELPRGDRLEKVAFTYCKVATVALLTGPYCLPIAATLAAVFYLWAYFEGKKDTRCILKYPLLIAAFWLMVTVVWIVIRFR